MKYVLILSFILLILSPYTLANAACCTTGTADPAGCSVCLTNPLTGTTKSEGIPTLLGKIINSVLGIVGSLALVMFIYGGIIWMTSSGNAEQVTKGKNIVIWATIGLVVIFSAYALVNFVLTKALGVT